MNKLPYGVSHIIYLYKHNLEYKEVMDELLQCKINVYFYVSLKQARLMCYVYNNISIQCGVKKTKNNCELFLLSTNLVFSFFLVSWRYCDCLFYLDLKSGYWKVS